MKNYLSLSEEERKAERLSLQKRYDAFCAKGLKLNMARGLPSVGQLDLSSPLLTIVTGENDTRSENGTEVRQYGLLAGLDEAARIFTWMCGAPREKILVTGPSSLNTMYDTVCAAMVFGTKDGCPPWAAQGKVKFLCPVPGYDRHFGICELFGIEMINIPMTENGPDTDAVEKAVRDPAVKGMWCIPKFSNPTGCVYSEETVRRLASLSPAAPDFRLFWDNAYCVHDFTGHRDLPDILALTEGTPNEDMVYMFASTAKVTFPGGGISAFMSSPRNIEWFTRSLKMRTICYDKVNQLRHARFFPTRDSLFAHMEKHAALLRPKFETVLSVFFEELDGTGIAEWTKPTGGYFISLDVYPGTASRVFRLCSEAGLTLTKVGATFPYGRDPEDKNLRIAPAYPDTEELKTASELVAVCAKLAALDVIK